MKKIICLLLLFNASIAFGATSLVGTGIKVVDGVLTQADDITRVTFTNFSAVNCSNCGGGSAPSVNSVVQRNYTTFWQNINGTAIIPIDTSIPQINEGFRVFSTSFTPQYSNSTIRITTNIAINTSTVDRRPVCALFNTNSVDAKLTTPGVFTIHAKPFFPLVMEYEEPALNTSERGYVVRCGVEAAAILYINAIEGNNYYGGTRRSNMLIEEIKQ